MGRSIVGAAFFAAGVLGADISVTSYIMGLTGLAAQAQDTSSSSPDLANPNAVPSGFGNGGAGFGSSAAKDVAPKAGGVESGTGTDTAAEGAAAENPGSEKPDLAGTDKEQGRPADGEGEDKAGTAKPLDGEPEAAAMAAASATATPTETIQSSARASVPNVSGTGNLTSSILLDVPGFRGLEPSLTLTYDSSRKTKTGATYQGWLGYAWGLEGFDVIERASVGYGVPAFDASDVFLFNGMELVPCAAGVVSPSCATGGTHTTENESYRRIAFNGTTNEWKVSDRDGTVSIFRSVAAVSGTTPAVGTPAYDLGQNYRWLLTAVTDTNGNSVTYSYSCSDSPVCYPEVVSYNGTEIRFHREVRPDYILMANGHDISQTTQRIRTISIKVGGVLRDAYKLSYNQAPMSNTSRLARVDRYGRNATVVADGAISGGTQKLVQMMNYQDAAANYGATSTITLGTSSPSGSLDSPAIPRQIGDLDADGRDELYGVSEARLHHPRRGDNDSWTEYRTHVSSITFNPDGQFKARSKLSLGSGQDDGYQVKVGRLLANKITSDLIPMRIKSQETSQGTQYYSAFAMVAKTSPTLALSAGDCAQEYAQVCANFPVGGVNAPDPNKRPSFVADMDGDGIDQLHRTVQPNGSYYAIGSALAGTFDLLGNGRQRGVFWDGGNLWRADRDSSGWWSRTYVEKNGCSGSPVDINGDGATDLVSVAMGMSATVCLSTGRAFKKLSMAFPTLYYPEPYGGTVGFADFDNDGRSEIVSLQFNSNGDLTSETGAIKVFALQFKATGHAGVHFPALNRQSQLSMGDFNGDGIPDFRTGSNIVLSTPGPGNPNLLRSVTTGTGAVVSAEYTPSSRWANDFLPSLMHAVTKLSVSDGRGGPAAVTDYAYAGGKYDPKARRFLGFRTVVEAKPAAAGETGRPVVETTYRQDLASYGLVASRVEKDGAGVARRSTTETYAANATTRPYWVQNTATDTTLTENIALSLKIERMFDAYNNVTNIKDHGRTDVTGDETWTMRLFVPNTSAYIVSLPRLEKAWAGFDTSLPAIKYGHSFYDGNHTDNNVPPTKGNLTWVHAFADAALQTSVNEYFSYDSYGNKIAAVDGAGHRTEWDYDATYHLYPVTERAPKYFATGGQAADTRFVSTASYDVVCGQPATRTDPTASSSPHTYDAFCCGLTTWRLP
ncbi:toxin TcdB middle/N-terminal domain-containing protein (plasmid) [Aminobacter sp. BA135]|uniref:toxin TcdB middle/N-terminal domain-containing protein n=1 Tax=Aminobacter sp. BA135 TaxID=537596 RepID=UPI003D7B9418